MEKLIKENLIYIVFAIAVIIAGGYYAYDSGIKKACENYRELSDKKVLKQDKEDQLAQIKAAKERNRLKKAAEAKSGKVIVEVPGMQFSSEASFGLMFENIIANITNSGLRVRSIDYNYRPTEDKVLSTGVEGYNACELSFTTAGNYTQLQNFFKNITKEKYLSNLQEIYIEPYDNDKTILIAKFKIRLYTRSV